MDQPFLVVIGVVAGAAVLGVIAYFVVRRMKGRMDLELAGDSVRAGDRLSGALKVEVRNNLHAERLYVALIGERLVRRHGSNGKSSSKWVEFYRDELDLLLDDTVRAGAPHAFSFDIEAPTAEKIMQAPRDALGQLQEAMAGTDNAIAAGLAKGIGALAASSDFLTSGKKKWTLAGRLETKGVDLAVSERVHVSLR